MLRVVWEDFLRLASRAFSSASMTAMVGPGLVIVMSRARHDQLPLSMSILMSAQPLLSMPCSLVIFARLPTYFFMDGAQFFAPPTERCSPTIT